MFISKGRMMATSAIGLAALTAAPVMAQTSDNATVDANATLQQVVPPLSVSGLQALNFGTVNIPNGVVAGNQCSYDISASKAATVSTQELNSNGGTVDLTFPTPSNCEATGEVQSASFTISCNAATPTTVTYALNSPLAGSGVVLTNTVGSEMIAVQDNDGPTFQTTPNDTFSPTCPDGSGTGSIPGLFEVRVGGRLIIGDTATPGANITVGTITLTATY